MNAPQDTVLSADRLNQPVLDQARRDFAWISVDQSVGEALAHVQRSQIRDQIVYFYVLDDQRRLVGVVPTRGLLLNGAATPVAEIMLRNVVKLPESATLLDACELFMLHRLMALPVVDDHGRMLAVLDVSVYTDEIIDIADRELSADVFQMIGVRLAQVRQASGWTIFRRRFPWLLCNITGGVACAVIAGAFRATLEQIIALALFMPVVLALAESVSMQSVALSLQLHYRGRMRWQTVLADMGREVPVGVLLGIATALPVALVAWAWLGHTFLALSMLASVALAVTTSALLGRLVPIVLRGLQRDPKMASGPIALALSDVATLSYFLGLAAWWVAR